MPLEPAISIDQHDGLRLDLPAALVGPDAATDLLDVDWDTRGVLGSRMGAKEFTTKHPAQAYDVLFGHGVKFAPLGETFALLARRGETIVKLNEKGEEEGGTIEADTGRLSFTQVGAGGILTPITYIANQNKQVRKFDGAAFSSPTATVDGVAGKAMPVANFIANWQDGGNRLVCVNTTLAGGPAGAAGSPSHVFFSEPGQPEAFESTAYVQLNPGDGQQILGCCAWGRELFVFKETYVCVFYGVSADEEGKPIFNFRTIDLGTKAVAPEGPTPPNVCPGRDGVYFLARDGVWVTNGGPPVRVTGALELSAARREPRTSLGGLSFPGWNRARGVLYADNCIYVGINEALGGIPLKRIFKVDLATGRATYWKANFNSFMWWAKEWGGTPRVFFSGAGVNGIFYYTPEANEDPTVEMEPYFESGYYDLGNPDEKTLTQTKLWGSGTVKVAVAEDYGEYGKTKTFKLGAGSAVTQAEQQRGQSATLLSHKFSGSAPWSVQRITRYRREDRIAATEKK